MKLLSKRNSGIIIRQFAGLGAIGGRKCNTIVDVQNTASSARRPDDGCGLDAIMFGVDISIGPLRAGDGRAGRSLPTGQFQVCVQSQ